MSPRGHDPDCRGAVRRRWQGAYVAVVEYPARLLGVELTVQLTPSMARARLRDLRLGLVALPLGDTFITQRNMIDPQVQAIQAGAEMARVGLLPLSGGRDFVHAGIEAHVAELRAVCRMLDIEWAGLGAAR